MTTPSVPSDLQLRLRTITDADVPDFSLKGQDFVGKVVDIYDGDTCKVVLLYKGEYAKFTCRLFGLDTPEMKPPMSKPNREEEIAAAKRCRNRFIQLATNCRIDIGMLDLSKKDIKAMMNDNSKLVRVVCGEFDKYGRLLVTLYDKNDIECNTMNGGGKSFNSILVEEKYANPYYGGTKETF
jgi:endonuclease YncB( thermonuclease family)